MKQVSNWVNTTAIVVIFVFSLYHLHTCNLNILNWKTYNRCYFFSHRAKFIYFFLTEFPAQRTCKFLGLFCIFGPWNRYHIFLCYQPVEDNLCNGNSINQVRKISSSLFACLCHASFSYFVLLIKKMEFLQGKEIEKCTTSLKNLILDHLHVGENYWWRRWMKDHYFNFQPICFQMLTGVWAEYELNVEL